MPLFLVERIPKENPFKTLRGYLPYLAITLRWMCLHRVYIVPDSLPYTFSPLYVFSPINYLSYLLIPQKKTMPLFLVARIPKENPFKTLGGYFPYLAITLCWMCLHRVYIVPDSLPYKFFPLSIVFISFHIF